MSQGLGGTGLVERIERTLTNAARSVGVHEYVHPDQLVRAVEFGAVGASGAVVNAVVFLSLVQGHSYLVPGMVAFWTAIAWTFGLNWMVTFADTTDHLATRFARYIGVSVLGYVVYTVVLSTAVELVHLAYPLAVVAAIAIAGTWNFLGAEVFAMEQRL